MNESLSLAEKKLLTPSGLSLSDMPKLLAGVESKNIDYGDLYFQYTEQESWVIEDSIIKEGSFNIEQGVGVRAIAGEKTGFAYSDDINSESIAEVSKTASTIGTEDSTVNLSKIVTSSVDPLYSSSNPITSLDSLQKIELLKRADKLARELDHHVVQVIASLNSVNEVIMVAATDGTLAADIRPLVRFNITIIVEKQGKKESASSGGGGRYDLTELLKKDKGIDQVEMHVKRAVRQANINLDAVAAPAGTMEVVLASGWPGILLHEAVGHGLEGDFNRKGSSAFSGKVGQKVASDLCTIVDDATIANRRGSLTIDDEGVVGQNTILIENGVLKGYMQDKLNARLMKAQSTGNGRRESFAHLPMPRMTNTYMLPGKHEEEEIIASVKNGLYCANFGGGQVDITSGKFVFTASEAYLIKDGKIGQAVKGATLIGNGPEAMKHVSMVGNDMQLDSGVGTCGKEGQSVPVGVGQPMLKIDELTVGGTQT